MSLGNVVTGRQPDHIVLLLLVFLGGFGLWGVCQLTIKLVLPSFHIKDARRIKFFLIGTINHIFPCEDFQAEQVDFDLLTQARFRIEWQRNHPFAASIERVDRLRTIEMRTLILCLVFCRLIISRCSSSCERNITLAVIRP